MRALPQLPATIQRKLALQWMELIEKLGFDGDHAQWHENERKRRRRIMRQNSWDRSTYASHYPEAVDAVGVALTVDLAKKRFEQLRLAYLPVWASSQDAHLEEFTRWLEQIRELLVGDIARLWTVLSEWHSEWFARACEKKVAAELNELSRQEVSRVRNFEIKHLENPHLSLSMIVAADGNLSAASLLQRREEAIRSGREALERWRRTTDSKAITGEHPPARHVPVASTTEHPSRLAPATDVSPVELHLAGDSNLSRPSKGPSAEKRVAAAGIEERWNVELRKLREKRGLSRPDLAHKLGISADAIKKHEEGTLPNSENQVNYADFFGVPKEALFPPNR